MSGDQKGGCIYGNYIALELYSSMFYNCQSGLFGGAIFAPIYLQIVDVTFQNCQSKIGGAIVSNHNFKGNAKNVKFINNQALAYTDFYSIAQQDEGVFRINSIFQLNRDLKNTSQYLIQNEIIHKTLCDKNFFYIYENDTKIEIPDDTQFGNMYEYLSSDYELKQYYLPLQIGQLQRPFLIVQYHQDFNYQNFGPPSLSLGCFDPIPYCYNGQQQQLETNYLEIEPVCSYCSNNQFSYRNDTPCVSCQNQKLEQCYSNNTSVKSSYWRSEYSNNLDRVYYCSLNEKSCQGQNRQGFLNDLCSEGYIGVMCLGCDYYGQFWNTQYGSSGYYKVGGAIISNRDFQENAEEVKFINNQALASYDFYNIEPQDLGIFRINSIFQLNRDFQNTSQYLIQNEIIYRNKQIISKIQKGFLYLIFLDFYVNDTKFEIPDTYFGNMYEYLSNDYDLNKYYLPLEIGYIQRPFLIVQYHQDFNCTNGKYILLTYNIFKYKDNEQYGPSSLIIGCFDPINYCYNGQQQQIQINYLETEPFCSYCSNNQFSYRNDTPCVSCLNQKLQQCYSNITFVRSSYSRSEYSNNLDRVYYCSLNEKSCQGQNRQGFLKDLCSEGYIGVMCLGCDYYGQFWNTQYGSSGYQDETIQDWERLFGLEYFKEINNEPYTKEDLDCVYKQKKIFWNPDKKKVEWKRLIAVKRLLQIEKAYQNILNYHKWN
ncbi:hypothetical protein ABPG72_022231 [Tetrahymena utriculariae]